MLLPSSKKTSSMQPATASLQAILPPTPPPPPIPTPPPSPWQSISLQIIQEGFLFLDGTPIAENLTCYSCYLRYTITNMIE